MADDKVIVTKTKLDALATSISEKSGASLPLTIAQMKAAVDGIAGGTITQDEDGYLVLSESGLKGYARVAYYKKFFPEEIYSNKNKLSLQLEPSTSYNIRIRSINYPDVPSEGYYKCLFFNISEATYPNSTTIQRVENAILRANGTIGTDGAMCSFNTTTGLLSLGGAYGYFYPEDEYEVIQIIYDVEVAN